MASFATLLRNTEEFVKKALIDNDASHDFDHIDRVRKLALNLALRESSFTSAAIDMEIVELSALLHDIADPKVGLLVFILFYYSMEEGIFNTLSNCLPTL